MIKDKRGSSDIASMVLVGLVILLLIGAVLAYPIYGVWRREMARKASLAEVDPRLAALHSQISDALDQSGFMGLLDRIEHNIGVVSPQIGGQDGRRFS